MSPSFCSARTSPIAASGAPQLLVGLSLILTHHFFSLRKICAVRKVSPFPEKAKKPQVDTSEFTQTEPVVSMGPKELKPYRMLLAKQSLENSKERSFPFF